MDHWNSNLDCIRFGLYEKALPPDLAWPERLRTAARAGYEFVEIAVDDTDGRIARLDWTPGERAALRSAILDTGVPIQSMSLSAHRRYPLGSSSPHTRSTGLDILKKAIDFAVDLGLRLILVCGADNYYEGTTPESEARFLDGLEQGFERATAAGVMLALENWDVGTNSLHKAMCYVRHFNSPWFQLYVDIGNLIYAGYDVLTELDAADGHIAALHVKDTLPGQLRYVPLGQGLVPFVAAFTRLAELGFQAPVALELWTENDPDSVDIVFAANTWVRARMAEGWARAARQPAEGLLFANGKD